MRIETDEKLVSKFLIPNPGENMKFPAPPTLDDSNLDEYYVQLDEYMDREIYPDVYIRMIIGDNKKVTKKQYLTIGKTWIVGPGDQLATSRSITPDAVLMASMMSPDKIEFWDTSAGDVDPDERIKLNNRRVYIPGEGWKEFDRYDQAFRVFLEEVGIYLGFCLED